ncbi:HET-domain-containing protein [Pyrenochaeta sp. DS3sAY3a]|nr:HET-domain-containing protein [Pyrenochaeta sp. DS3sAY3a]
MSSTSDHDRHLALQAPLSNEQSTTDLCDKCQLLGNLLDACRSRSENRRDFILGSFEDLQAKPWCGFCVIICKYIPKTALPPSVALVAVTHHQDGVLIYAPGYRSAHPVRLRVPLANPKSEFGYEGPPRACDPSEVDVELVRKWINCCDFSHGDDCLSASLSPPQHSIWLVDVIEGCLISATSTSRYVALSYVWGATQCDQTTKSNLHKMQIPGTITPDNAKLQIPTTVKDALRLVISLQERFLWVDSLCIIQDDEHSKQMFLESMASIYANATFTIVAADGSDANFGIRGIGSGTLPRSASCDVVRFQSQDILVSSDRVWSPEGSPWADRGWTYQEGLFSRRVLLFNGLVTWRCQQALWQEHLYHPSEDGNCAELPPIFRSTVPLCVKIPMWPDLYTWQILTEEFNTRKLTYERDVVDAFLGVTSAIKHRFPGGIFWGIPEMFFDHGLLWVPRGITRRRGAEDNTGNTSKYPSWSWIGWEGDICPFKCFHYTQNPSVDDQVIRFTPMVIWYTQNLFPGNFTPISNNYSTLDVLHLNDEQSSLPPGWSRQLHFDDNTPYYSHSTIPSVEFRYPIQLQPEVQTENGLPIDRGQHLYFRTKRAHLFIGEKIEDEWRTFAWKTCAVRLVDNDDKVVGSLNLNLESSDAVSLIGEKCEVICLSYGTAVASGDYQGIIGEWDVLDEVVDKKVRTSLGIYPFYNVMWVEYVDNIAYRKAIGTVYRYAWESQDLEEFDVVLG